MMLWALVLLTHPQEGEIQSVPLHDSQGICEIKSVARKLKLDEPYIDRIL